MQKFYFSYMFLVIIAAFILFLTGCGNNNPATNNGTGVTVPASAYTKLTSGNTWAWNVSQNIISSASILGVASTSTLFFNASQTSQYGIVTASGTTVTTSYVIPAAGTYAPSPNFLNLDVSGNLIGISLYPVASSAYTYLPANLFVGVSWNEPGIMAGVVTASGTIRYTVTGINISKAVPGFAIPFNDVMQVDISGNSISSSIIIPGIGTLVTPANITGSYFISKQVGNVVYANVTVTASSSAFFTSAGSIIVPTTLTLNSTQILQPGYIAN